MTELAALVRFIHLAAAVLMVGSYGFVFLIVRPAANQVGGAAVRLMGIQWKFHLLTAWALLFVLLVSALLTLWLQLINVAGSTGTVDLSAIRSLLTGTFYGKVWLVRVGLIIAIALILKSVGKRDEIHSASRFASGLALSAAVLASITLSGHAAAAEGVNFAAHAFLDVAHLIATGLWLGGLVPLLIFLRTSSRAGDPSASTMIQHATLRFSRLGLACVSILVVTGIYNAWSFVGTFPALFGTPYGSLLLIKLGLLLPLLSVAAINRRRLTPRFELAASNPPERTAALATRLSRNVIIEACFGMMILLVVGHMSVTPPAKHIQPDWPFSFRWDWGSLEKSQKARVEVERGLVWASIGTVAVLMATARRRRRLLSGAVAVGAFGYSGYVVHNAVLIDAYPATYQRPAVAYHVISVANGKRLYQESGCMTCHGPSGYGDGPGSQELDPKPADLTAPHANTHTAGDLYWWLSHGVKSTSAMPGYNQSLSEEERWDLINFMRALSNGERARNLAAVIDDKPWLVAPDFAYSTNAGETKTLRDHRGVKIVLLVLLDQRAAQERLKQLVAARSQFHSRGVEIIIVPESLRQKEVKTTPGKQIPFKAVDFLEGGAATNEVVGLIVNEGIGEIRDTYSLFARSFSDEKPVEAVPHTEFLIDKQGYVRARWLPAENDTWKKPDVLLKQLEALRTEKPRALAPDDHVH